MRYAMLEKYRDGLLLFARILLVFLFVKFGLMKLTGFTDTIAYMASNRLPAPSLMTLIAVVMEFFVGLSIVLGFYTRPLALALAIYTVIAAVIGHPYWNMGGEMRYESMINFYKNISITGGLLMLMLTGPGRYSFDRR